MKAWLVLISLNAGAFEDGATPVSASAQERALLMPLRVSGTNASEWKHAVRGVERSLALSVASAAPFAVTTPADLKAILGQAVQEQLHGCDERTCATDIADAFGVDLVMLPQLDISHGLFTLQLSLLERKTAKARRRALVRTDSLDALLGSMDTMARQISAVDQLDLNDTLLPRRLATDAVNAELLRQRVRGRADADVTAEWTAMVVEHNRESGTWALLEGAAVGGSGVAIIPAALITGTNLSVFYAVSAAATVRQMRDRGEASKDFQYSMVDRGNPGNLYIFPVWLVPWLALSALPGVIAASAFLAGAAVLAVIDQQDPGRLPVGKLGCCRDEVALRDAARPSAGERGGGALAVSGVMLTALAPAVFMTAHVFSFFPAVIVCGVPLLLGLPVGPSAQLTATQWDLATNLGFFSAIIGAMGSAALFTGLNAGGALLLFTSFGSRLTDTDPAPLKAPDARKPDASPTSSPVVPQAYPRRGSDESPDQPAARQP